MWSEKVRWGMAVAAMLAVALSARFVAGSMLGDTGTSTTTGTVQNSASVPVSPSGLALASSPTQTTVAIRWSDNSNNEDKFNLERKLSSDANWAPLALLMGADITKYYDQSVAPGQSYDYRVQACLSNIGCSGYATLSNVVTPSTASSTTYSLPAAPTELMLDAPAEPAYVKLRWRDNAGNEDKFIIERKLSNALSFAFLSQVGTDIDRFIDQSVTAGSTYDYRIRACQSGACSVPAVLTGILVPVSTGTSSSGTSSSTSGTSGGNAPAPVTGLIAASSCNAVSLTWANSNGAAYYKIARNGTRIGSSNVASYADTSVSPGVRYLYEIVAVNAYGISSGTKIEALMPASCTTAATTTMTAPRPAAPTELMLDGPAASSYVKLRWRDNATNEDSLNIERKLTSAASFSPLIRLKAADITRYIDTAVMPATSYDYRVQACLLNAGCSDFAVLQSVRTAFAEVKTTATTTTAVAPSPVPAPKPVPLPAEESAETPVSEVQAVPDASPVASSTSAIRAAAVALNLQNIGRVFDSSWNAVDEAKGALAAIIDRHVESAARAAGIATSSEELQKAREETVSRIGRALDEMSFSEDAAEPGRIEELLREGVRKIYEAAKAGEGSSTTNEQEIRTAIDEIRGKIVEERKAIASAGGDQLYKDSNGDGISDFDSVHVYGLDPKKPSPVSKIGDRTVTAGEKVLLGYDPKSPELVKVVPEEPAAAKAPVLEALKVQKVEMSEEKKLVFTGKALPNSYVTVYVYSTPVIVTVKAGANGEWVYIMDKELEDGDHTIYTATVDNSGKVLAKSDGYSFTKTAEAASLNVIPPLATAGLEEPRLFGSTALYVVVAAGAAIMLALLTFIGMRSRRHGDGGTGTPAAPTGA